MTRPLAERTAPRRSTAPVDGRRRDSQGERERRREGEGDANEVESPGLLLSLFHLSLPYTYLCNYGHLAVNACVPTSPLASFTLSMAGAVVAKLSGRP
jgi:hypothetical protein